MRTTLFCKCVCTMQTQPLFCTSLLVKQPTRHYYYYYYFITITTPFVVLIFYPHYYLFIHIGGFRSILFTTSFYLTVSVYIHLPIIINDYLLLVLCCYYCYISLHLLPPPQLFSCSSCNEIITIVYWSKRAAAK